MRNFLLLNTIAISLTLHIRNRAFVFSAVLIFLDLEEGKVVVVHFAFHCIHPVHKVNDTFHWSIDIYFYAS